MQTSYIPKATTQEFCEWLNLCSVRKTSEWGQQIEIKLLFWEIKEEIADLYEVLDTLIKNKNFSKDEILEIQKLKREKKWGFEKKIILTKY